ncbi:MAG: ATP-binding protein [Pseudomonadota bacterium]
MNENRPTRADDLRFKQLDNKDGLLAIMINKIKNDTGMLSVLSIAGADMTVQKILENQLVQVQKLESIGQLAAGMAHEINTPTQYVGDNTRFLQHAFNNLSGLLVKYEELIEAIKVGNVEHDFIREILKKAEEVNVDYLMKEIPTAIQQTLEGIERIAKIVLAMKDFLHPGTAEKTAIDINKAIESTITVARNEWNYVAELVTAFDPSLPLVPCMQGEFKQVILNMIINAAQAIADNMDDGTTGKGTITVSTSSDGDGVEIRISDTGAGIPKAFRTRIFDPFFTTREATGQGLTISHSIIVEKHGGTLTFDTEVGKGTTFTIRLPIETEEKWPDIDSINPVLPSVIAESGIDSS